MKSPYKKVLASSCLPDTDARIQQYEATYTVSWIFGGLDSLCGNVIFSYDHMQYGAYAQIETRSLKLRATTCPKNCSKTALKHPQKHCKLSKTGWQPHEPKLYISAVFGIVFGVVFGIGRGPILGVIWHPLANTLEAPRRPQKSPSGP